MNPALIIALLQQLIVPEILEIVRRRQAANQPIDDTSIIEELHLRAAAVIAKGESWLATHPA